MPLLLGGMYLLLKKLYLIVPFSYFSRPDVVVEGTLNSTLKLDDQAALFKPPEPLVLLLGLLIPVVIEERNVATRLHSDNGSLCFLASSLSVLVVKLIP